MLLLPQFPEVLLLPSLEPQVQLDRRVLKVVEVQLVPPVLKDLLEILAQLEELDHLVLPAPQDKELPVQQALQEELDLLVLPARVDLQEPPDLLGRVAQQDQPVRRVTRVLPAQLVIPVVQDQLDPPDLQDPQVTRVQQDQPVRLAILDQLVLLARVDLQVRPEPLELAQPQVWSRSLSPDQRERLYLSFNHLVLFSLTFPS